MEKQRKVEVASWGNGKITIEVTAETDLELIVAALRYGTYYIRVQNGNLEAIPVHEELPPPFPDENMLPFWRRATTDEMAGGREMFDAYIMDKSRLYSPAIFINHLATPNYTKKKYIENGQKLTSYGFECLRSRRGKDGKFWETWFLPGLWAAKGDLGQIISIAKDTEKQRLDAAIGLLRKEISFATLDVSEQRLAISIDD